MYVLAIIEDKVKIEPEQFERDQTEVKFIYLIALITKKKLNYIL